MVGTIRATDSNSNQAAENYKSAMEIACVATNLEHPGGNYSPHFRHNLFLYTLKVVGRRLSVLLGLQHIVQNSVVEQVDVLVRSSDGVHLAAQQLVLHGRGSVWWWLLLVLVVVVSRLSKVFKNV